jgi:hypothetical protein
MQHVCGTRDLQNAPSKHNHRTASGKQDTQKLQEQPYLEQILEVYIIITQTEYSFVAC